MPITRKAVVASRSTQEGPGGDLVTVAFADVPTGPALTAGMMLPAFLTHQITNPTADQLAEFAFDKTYAKILTITIGADPAPPAGTTPAPAAS